MGYRLILRKTLIDLTKWRATAALIVLGLSVPLLVSLAWRDTLSLQAFSSETRTYYITSNFATIAIIWSAGLFPALLVGTAGAGIISREMSEGTLLILVSKATDRRGILLGKFTAIVIHALLIESLCLVLFTVILWFTVSMGLSTFIALLASLPLILLYSLIVILLFGAISIALSSLSESQTLITATVIAVVVFFFLFGIFGQVLGLSVEAYETYHLYLIDGSYNLGNAFSPILSQMTGGAMLPAVHLETLQAFTGVFVGGREASGGMAWEYVSGANSFSHPAELAGYVEPLVSVVAMFMTTVAAMSVALWRVTKMDIN